MGERRGEELELGAAGASARREYRRRQARRRARAARRGWVGRLMHALEREPADDRNWAMGAAAEEALASSLQARCPDAIVLHDRRLPGTRANIDHVAVVPSGVWVIDSKRYTGKIRVRKPLLGAAELRIKGRNRTKLIDGLERQVSAVTAAVEELAPGTAVHGCLCFHKPHGEELGLPLLHTLRIRGYPLLSPRRLAKRLKQPGPLAPERGRELAAELARRFPPA